MDGRSHQGKEDELWELKVRSIAASELARSAMQSAMRTAGIVDSFMGHLLNHQIIKLTNQ